MRLMATGRPPLFVLCAHKGDRVLFEIQRAQKHFVYVCQGGVRDCSTKCVDVPSPVAIAKGSRPQAALEQEVAPVDLEHFRNLLVEVRRVCFDNCYLFGVELRQHELVLNPSVLLLDPLLLFEELELPLFGLFSLPLSLFSLPLSLGRDFRCKELATSNRKDQGDDNNDDHGDCNSGAAIPQRLEDVDVLVLG